MKTTILSIVAALLLVSLGTAQDKAAPQAKEKKEMPAATQTAPAKAEKGGMKDEKKASPAKAKMKSKKSAKKAAKGAKKPAEMKKDDSNPPVKQ